MTLPAMNVGSLDHLKTMLPDVNPILDHKFEQFDHTLEHLDHELDKMCV